MTDTSPILAVPPPRCPSRQIGLDLTPATIEELAGERESQVSSTAPPPEPDAAKQLSLSAAATKTRARRVGGLAALIVADASRRRTGPDQAPDPQGATMSQEATPTVSRTALALNIPVGDAREQQQAALWAMSPTERVAAMWRGDLTLYQLSRWTSRAPYEVPLVGGEFAWIVMRTPEWAEAADERSDNVIYLTERWNDRAAA